MNIDESQRIGENVGFAKVQQAKDFKCKDTGSITYDINWKYTTNLSGKRKFIFTGKQIDGYSSNLKSSPISPGDTVIFRRQGHPNNGKRGEVSRIIMPMTPDEIALAGLDARKIPDFEKVYEINFKRISSGPNSREVKQIRTSKEEELQKYINHRTLLCVNLSEDYFKDIYLVEERKKLKEQGKSYDRQAQINIINSYNDFISTINGQNEVYEKKSEIIINKLKREKDMLFLKNKKFRPDYVFAWELKERNNKLRGNQLTMPDSTYYIMKSKITDLNALTDTSCGEKIEKIWITVHITLRKEALTLQDDILLNGTLFLNCDERKEEIWKILGKFKKSSDKALEKIFNVKGDIKGRKRRCALQAVDKNIDIEKEYVYEFGDEVEIKYDVELKNVENPWDGWIKAKIQNKRGDNKYEVIILDSNISIDNVPAKYIRNLNRNLQGGKNRKSRKRKNRRRRKTRKKALRN